MDITLADDDAGQRLDRFLRKAFRATPLSLIQKALRTGRVRVNGKREKKGATFLNPGDRVECAGIDFKKAPSIAETVAVLAKDMTPLILYEDTRFIIVNKPSGLPVHSGAFHESDTLIDLIQGYLGKGRNSLTFAPALAHRLDKGVSGVVLAAKTADALRLATEAFRDGTIKKRYVAIIKGAPWEDKGEINTPLPDKKGILRESKTQFHVVKRFKDHALLEIDLFTGRMHQIRRHLSEKNMPIVGDLEYGGPPAPRILLHAHKISFRDFTAGQTITAEAPIPEPFHVYMKRLAG